MPENVCEDKISELSDDLLVRILLLVPTKVAMATMILSKRWRLVWTMMPKLKYKERKESVWWFEFLYKSLQLHKAPVIDSLCIELGPLCPTEVDVGKWVAKVVDERFARVLKFKLRWSANPTTLPKSFYTCETLVKLKLSHKILIDFPSLGCLPSLKKLSLSYVVYKDEASLVRFLSSCPVLEKLLVKRMNDDNVRKFCVKVPSLWFLSYYNDISLPYDSNVVHTDRCLVMDTPELKHFSIEDSSDDYCSIENMPCLDSADISFDTYFLNDNKFLRCISSVLSLTLCLADEMLLRCSTNNFSRLVKLSICPSESDWLAPLILLLGNFPKLEHLLVHYTYTDQPEDLPLSWNQPNSVPGCLSSHLKIFEWTQGYRGREEEKEFVTYILANSKCLKSATISIRYISYYEELESIPRASKSSKLLFK